MNLSMFSLEGKVALVTGGTGGIGSCVARALVEAGAHVIISGSSELTLKKAEDELKLLDDKSCGIVADVTKLAEVKQMTKKIMDQYLKIDILVNCVGINMPEELLNVTEESWDKVMAVNLKGVLFCCQEVARFMLNQKGQGRIINMTSNASAQGFRGLGAYCASKGGLMQLTKTMAIEWAPKITVNAVAPGYIKTKMTELYWEDKVRTKAVLDRTPLGRIGEAKDLNGLIIYLASDASSFLTGESIYIDGGWVMSGSSVLG